MRKLILLLVPALFILGCQSDNPATDVPKTPEYRVFFDQYENNYLGFSGEETVIPISATVYESSSTGRIVPLGTRSVEGISVGFTVEGVTGRFEPSSTISDSAGRIRSTLYVTTPSGYRDFRIRATTETSTNESYCTIEGVSRPARCVLTVPSHRLVVPRGQTARMKITGLVSDSSGVGVSGLFVTAAIHGIGNSAFGSISFDRTTNRSGSFEIFYTSNGGFGSERIEISLSLFSGSAALIETSANLVVASLEDQVSRFTLNALPETILLPAGSEATPVIQALAIGLDGRPVPGLTVEFSTSIGVIQESAITDSVGIAHALWHTGILPGDATISAQIPGTAFTASGVVHLRNPVRETLSRITLFTDAFTHVAGSQNSSWIEAVCLKSDGSAADGGTLVRIHAEGGDGHLDAEYIALQAGGTGVVHYFVGNTIGVTRIYATADNGSGTLVRSNTIEITAIAGDPHTVNLSPSRQQLPVDEIDASVSINALVRDEFGNPIAGALVSFTATIGNIIPLTYTDENGECAVNLTASGDGRTGQSEIRGTCEGVTGVTLVNFTAAQPGSFDVRLSRNRLKVAGNGEESQTTITVLPKDRSGHPFLSPLPFHFRLMNPLMPPQGPSFPNGTTIDSTMTANGSGSIVLSAGAQIGGVLLRVNTWRDADRTDEISVIHSIIAVVSSWPTTVSLDYDPRGVDAGGGIWSLEVAARFFDDQQNPVSDSLPVTFTVNPDIATISNGFIGNRGRGGSLAGVAFASLNYHSLATFDTVEIMATVNTPNGIVQTTRVVTLPLQRGWVLLSVDPVNWMFDRGSPRDTCLIRLWATVRDGHDILINNASILFRTDRGDLWYRNWARNGQLNIFAPDNPARRPTGVEQNHEQPGEATVYLRGQMSDFFLDDFSQEIPVHLEASIDGTDVAADPVTVMMLRH